MSSKLSSHPRRAGVSSLNFWPLLLLRPPSRESPVYGDVWKMLKKRVREKKEAMSTDEFRMEKEQKRGG